MLGKTLKQYRRKYKITQRSLSRISGVDRDLISRIERGMEKADAHIQGLIINALLRDKTHFHPEQARGLDRGEQLGLLLSTLSDEMAEQLYVDIINKLKDYVGFQIDVDVIQNPALPVKSRRKYVQYKF